MSGDDAYDVLVQTCASIRGQALVALPTPLIARRFPPKASAFVRQTHSGHSPKRHTNFHRQQWNLPGCRLFGERSLPIKPSPCDVRLLSRDLIDGQSCAQSRLVEYSELTQLDSARILLAKARDQIALQELLPDDYPRRRTAQYIRQSFFFAAQHFAVASVENRGNPLAPFQRQIVSQLVRAIAIQ